ncbi:MAG TPA: SCP2 sterol-binding domain-containing protein [Dokdonella sp.]|uniref:ubiquinone biosynthesis accessory factor UbiJ n=1 Tax=Dokdonella sp. TaxID=2291710 RepID=UPI002CE3F2B8|nr:SCP2 sterol-binding domain-containing protein [Dokdonella sp.]HOX71651.1 SCP2 sterol-binding domain-containing protein [Dokdonella sp.]HPG93148.1 SCP2 sterol-binding domain-containing protein [Dokdonella sp.]HPN78223.1 SCP2 sterol-binding domain-containing protein [Dokdonella sp.]
MTISDTAAPRAPNPLLRLLGRGLETALNHALSLDADTRASLGPLDGRAVRVDFRGTGLAMRIAVQGERLLVGPAFEGDSQLRVSATPGSLIGMAAARLRGQGDAGLPPGQVEIAGDAELARRLERLATRFEPDIDEAFARVFGDVIGFQTARLFRRGFAHARESASSLLRDGADYLVEESRDLIAKPEMEQFLDEVDEVRERGDRLEARLKRLTAAQPR